MLTVGIAAATPAVVLISTREAADYGTKVSASGAVAFITKAELSAWSFARAVERR